MIRLRRHPFIHPRSTDRDRSANFRTPLFRAHARLLLPIPATVSQLNTWLLVTPKWYVDKINFAEAITIRTSSRDDGKIRAPRAPHGAKSTRGYSYTPQEFAAHPISHSHILSTLRQSCQGEEAGYMAFAWQNLPTPASEG